MALKEAGQEWQLECKELKQRGAWLLNSGQWSDCVFAVGAAGIFFKAHKLLVAAASPVFAAMCYDGLVEGSKLISVPEIEVDTFKIMLGYIYTDKVNLQSFSIACDVYYAAQKYNLPHLKAACVTFMSKELTPHSVCNTYEMALRFGEKELKDNCLQMMQSRTNEVLEAKSFLDAKVKTVQELFAVDHLDIDSELQLLEAAELYTLSYEIKSLQSGCSTLTDTEDSGSASADVREPKTILRKAVQNIRFLTLTPEEFAKHGSLSILLTESEALAILINIATKDAPTPMPVDFSTSRTKRNMVDKARTKATFQAVVNVENLETYYSTTFYVRNLPWRLRVRGDGNNLSVELHCNWNNTGPWKCYAEVELSLLSHNLGQSPDVKPFYKKFTNVFTSNEWDWRYPEFICWKKLLDPVNGYVRYNNIALEVYIDTTKLPLSCDEYNKVVEKASLGNMAYLNEE